VAVAIFLQINDQINNVLGRCSRSDSHKPRRPVRCLCMALLAILADILCRRSAATKNDLIDLLDDPAPSARQSSNPANELADLFGDVASVSAPVPVAGQSRGGGSPNLVGLAPCFGGIMLPASPQPSQTQAHLPQAGVGSQRPQSQSQLQQQPQASNKDLCADLAGLFKLMISDVGQWGMDRSTMQLYSCCKCDRYYLKYFDPRSV
jgi:hypothetical protein